MDMPGLTNTLAIDPVCTPGTNKRKTLADNIGLPKDAYTVLVGMGGVPYSLTVTQWPAQIHHKSVFYIVPDDMLVTSQEPPHSATMQTNNHNDQNSHNNHHDHKHTIHTISSEQTGLSYSDLVASVDLIITKPGYGMFVEAAAAGVPVLYVERPGWPEAEALTSWLQSVAHCAEIDTETLQQGLFAEPLSALLKKGPYPPVPPSGNLQAAEILQSILTQTD